MYYYPNLDRRYDKFYLGKCKVDLTDTDGFLDFTSYVPRDKNVDKAKYRQEVSRFNPRKNKSKV